MNIKISNKKVIKVYFLRVKMWNRKGESMVVCTKCHTQIETKPRPLPTIIIGGYCPMEELGDH
jgi:hypothetical protein